MSQIDEKTKIPLSLVITIVVLAVSVASTAAVSHFRLTNLEKEWEEAKIREAKSLESRQANDLRVQKLELTLDGIKDTVEKIDRKIDRLERK